MVSAVPGPFVQAVFRVRILFIEAIPSLRMEKCTTEMPAVVEVRLLLHAHYLGNVWIKNSTLAKFLSLWGLALSKLNIMDPKHVMLIRSKG